MLCTLEVEPNPEPAPKSPPQNHPSAPAPEPPKPPRTAPETALNLSIATDIYLEHIFSKISEPLLRTSEKQILRTSPLIFAYLEHSNTHILRTYPVTLVNLHIYTQIPWWTPYLEHFLPSLLQHSIPFLRAHIHIYIYYSKYDVSM